LQDYTVLHIYLNLLKNRIYSNLAQFLHVSRLQCSHNGFLHFDHLSQLKGGSELFEIHLPCCVIFSGKATKAGDSFLFELHIKRGGSE
jgi:hypothetical protein